MTSTAWSLLLIATCAFSRSVHAHPYEPSVPLSLLDGISNVASRANTFISGIVQAPKELLHQVTDTAADYIATAVDKPKNLLLNASRMTTGYIDSAASKGLEFKLRRFIEKFRARMPYGIPELGIPVLEPFHLDEIYIDIDNPEIGNVTVFIGDLNIRQLSNFAIDRAKLSLLGPLLAMNLSFPEIYATGYYNISGLVGDLFSLHGDGPFDITIYGLRIYVSTILGYSRRLYLKTFDLDFSLDTAKFHFENFMGDEEVGEMVNKIFQELTPEILDILKPDVLPIIRDYAAMQINETIHDMTMRDVIGVIIGHNELRKYADILIP